MDKPLDDNWFIEKFISGLGADKSGFEIMMVKNALLGLLLTPGTYFVISYKEKLRLGSPVIVSLNTGENYAARIAQMNKKTGVYLMHRASKPEGQITLKTHQIAKIGVIMCALFI